ncbi:MAG: GvpL/GvpF family gas vesicle protein [Leptolyngbyaceae cyanobacterium bins.59]|nr:GvpL/GvpF family gas vesicle protein [Leptolyngbyaceae cyanobacterium bins.59]
MYVYALLPKPDNPLVLPMGIIEPLRMIQTPDLAAVVELEVPWEDLEQRDERLIQAVLAHDRVIQNLFSQTDLLPLRFGTQFFSVETLTRHLESHRQEYLDKLRHLKGKAEYTLRLIPLPPPEDTAPLTELPGRAYFLAKKQRYTSQIEWQQQQEAQLEAFKGAVLQSSLEGIIGEPQEDTARIYLLAPRTDESSILNFLTDWQSACPGWQFVLDDPLPPYHFM